MQLECARVLNESLLLPFLMYGSETMILRGKERSRIRIDKVPNAWIRQLCGLTNGVDGKIDEVVLRWFGHVERM